MPKVGDPILSTFLQGVPPSGSDMLMVDGIEGQAWRYKGHIYLRSRSTMLSPGCIHQSVDDDANDMRVCEMEDVSPVLVSDGGKHVSVSFNQPNR